MRDQYNFLKAIDTSSSSPELKESLRPRRQLTGTIANARLASEAASSSASSNSNKIRADRAGLIKSKLQNLVRPRRFQLSSSGDSKSSSSRHQAQHQRLGNLHFAHQEESCGGVEDEEEEEDDEDNGEEDEVVDHPDDSDEESDELATEAPINEPVQHRLLALASPRQRRQVDTGDTKQPGVPTICQIRKRAPMKYREQQHLGQYLGGSGHHQQQQMGPSPATTTTTKNQFKTNQNQNHTSISAAAHATNYAPSETAKQTPNGRQELAKCYDEIDQIYDYIRGLAPLPANLRKIKAIDFEQIERERQRHKSAQLEAQVADSARPIHHQHRQRYVKSIGSSSQSSSVPVGAAVVLANGVLTNGQPTNGATATKKLAKVRQRVVAELIKDQGAPSKPPPPLQPPPQTTSAQQRQARTSSKLRETLQFIVPMPIRVTTKSAESQKPSIKRVESLNLGSNGERLRPEIRTTGQPIIKSTTDKQQDPIRLNPTKPSYLISATQRGQLFRLPRAHSTSTLNKPIATTIDTKRPIMIGGQQKQQLKHEPIIQEDFPLVRLAHQPQFHQQQQHQVTTGSLGRSSSSKKRPSFESDLVESYVDDDDDANENNGLENRPANPKTTTKASSNDRHHSTSSASLKSRSSGRLARESSATSGSSSSVEQEARDGSRASSGEDATSDDDDDRSASTSERWSYADDSSKNQRLADKSHSDYDNDSASETSETSATTTTTTTDTSTSNDQDHDNEEEDEEVRQSFAKEARQRSLSSKRSHSQLRPTTSSSPSSGRPASPVDMTNESDEMEMASAASHKSSSFASGSRHRQQKQQQPISQTTPMREEHIYEQIPAHKGRDRTQRHHQPVVDHLKQTNRLKQPTLSSGNQSMAPRRSGGQPNVQPASINHPVAYAANVAANRRYQQQVAALFALQQQRDRNQQLTRHRVPLGAPMATISYHPNHQRRSSATSNSQFMPSQAVAAPPPSSGGGPLSLTIGSLKWRHQAPRPLADVPHRQRLSMGNIHLLSGTIPLASLCSPKSKQRQQQQVPIQNGRQSLFNGTKERRTKQNTNSLEDQEAGSTGTTNSTSSYEAAIKNSEPDPLRVDMICPSDGEQSRHASSKRSIGSGSGSRSLTNHSHHSMQNNNNVQQVSTLMKVPKLSKQSHLLQRPLPKPPVSNRSHASSNSRPSQKVSSTNSRTSVSSQPSRSAATAQVDVFN